jgi:hypothetical protein
MAFNATALNNYTKHTYKQDFIDNSLTSVMDAMLKSVKKDTSGSGRDYSWLADADDAFNASPDFTTAQTAATNNNNTVGAQFLSKWNSLSAVAQIPSDIIGITRNEDGAWQKAVDTAQKKTMRGIAHANQLFLLGKGWGEVSQITSVSASQFSPLIASDITKYVIGMPLVFSSSLNAAVLRSATVLYVTGVNYTQGQELVTVSGTMASVGGVNNDWAFIAGARQNSASPVQIVPIGLNGWFPNQLTDLSDATVTTMLGFNRLVNSRYFGSFIDATQGGTPLTALIDGAQEACTIGNAKKLECFCSKAVFAGIAKDANNAVRYDGNPATKSVGTSRLLVYADGQAEAHLNVSRTMNDTMIYGFDPSQICYKSIGGLPHIDMEDGLTMARQSSAAGYEIRWFQQSLIEVPNPAAGLRIQLV